VGSYAPADAGRPPRVELRLAGAFVVIFDGTELADRQIGSRKSRLLLKLLSASRPALVTTDQIADVLWDGAPPAGAEDEPAPSTADVATAPAEQPAAASADGRAPAAEPPAAEPPAEDAPAAAAGSREQAGSRMS